MRASCEPALNQSDVNHSSNEALIPDDDYKNSDDEFLNYLFVINEFMRFKKCLDRVYEYYYWAKGESEVITSARLSFAQEQDLNAALSDVFSIYKANVIPDYRVKFKEFGDLTPSGFDDVISGILPFANQAMQERYSKLIDKSSNDLGRLYE